MSNTQLKYHIDEETQRISIKIIDKDTDKVIREVPPEETLEAIKKIWEIAGIIVDEKRYQVQLSGNCLVYLLRIGGLLCQ